MPTFVKKEVLKVDLDEKIREQGLNFTSMDDLRSDFGKGMVNDDKDRRIHPVAYKSKHMNAMLKIPDVINTKQCKEMCDTAYSLYKSIDDHSNLMRLIESEDGGPFRFGEHSGVLMELGAGDLTQHELQSHGDGLDIIVQAAKGLSKIHHANFRHRDIKPSNIIYLEKHDEWVLADYGTAKSDDKTTSRKNDSDYWSYEFRENFAAESDGKKKLFYTYEEDIFQLGITLYVALTGKTFQKDFADVGGNYKKFVFKTIKDMDVSDDIKYFLRRLLGEKALKELPKEKIWEDFRYVSIDQFIEEVETGRKSVVKMQKPEEHGDYLNFLETKENLMNVLENIDSYKGKDNNYRAIEKNTIEIIEDTYEELLNQAKTENVRIVPEKDNVLQSVKELYTTIRQEEADLLDGEIDPLELSNTSDVNKLVDITERIFLFGAHPFTWKSRKGRKGKFRYSLQETNDHQTHYHETFIDMGLVK